MVTQGDRSGKGMHWELETGMYTLLYLKHITIRTNYIAQGTRTIFCNNLNGKKIWNKIDTCITDSLCCIPETNTILKIDYVLSLSVVSDSLRFHGPQSTRFLCPWGFCRQEGCHALLQGIFPTQGSNPGLPHCRRILYHLTHQGSPKLTIGKYKIKFLREKKLFIKNKF